MLRKGNEGYGDIPRQGKKVFFIEAIISTADHRSFVLFRFINMKLYPN